MRQIARTVTASALALLAAGCAAVGPNYRPPAPPSVAHYVSPGERGETAAGAPDQTVALGDTVATQWWTLFRSPQMDALVRAAVAGSPTLDAAKARLAEAREGVAEARSALYPQVGVSSGFDRAKQSAAAFGLQPEAFPLPPNFNLFQIGASASYSPDVFGGTRRQIEASGALADLGRDQLDAAYMTLTGETARQAVQVAAVRAQLASLETILAIDRQSLELTRKRRQVGEAPDSDVVSAEAQLAADETLRPALDQQASEAGHALAVLTGHPPGEWAPPALELSALTLPQRLPVSLPSALVHRRPDILAAEARLRAASAQVGVATARLYPTITLTASISESSLNEGPLFDPAGMVWSTAAGITQPVFDGGLRRAQRRAAMDEFRADAADYRQTVLLAFGQVADLLEALEHDSQQLADQTRALDLARQALDLQRINYSKGGTGLLDLLDAQRRDALAELGYAQAQAQRYQDSVALLAAMGGAWTDGDLAQASAGRAGR
jgi:NodT family efflux transporter outer membrane factor (OMF) lipoprotein